MFTGLVEGTGTVVAADRGPGGLTLAVDLGPLFEGVLLGDSVALDGCCLTVVALEAAPASVARFTAVPETLEKTTLGALAAGRRVNVERSLRLGDRLGGHIVQGHVDGVGRVARRAPEGEQVTFEVACDARLTALMVEKGSIAVDGVSLTLVTVAPGRFTFAAIPHTLAVTTLGERAPGDAVNLEADVLGKWVRAMVAPYLAR